MEPDLHDISADYWMALERTTCPSRSVMDSGVVAVPPLVAQRHLGAGADGLARSHGNEPAGAQSCSQPDHGTRAERGYGPDAPQRQRQIQTSVRFAAGLAKSNDTLVRSRTGTGHGIHDFVAAGA
jgi:hypothetical protein